MLWSDGREQQKCRAGENALLHAAGWVETRLLSLHAVVTSIPKKEIQCVEERESTFSIGGKLTVKYAYGFRAETALETDANNMQMTVQKSMGLQEPDPPIPRPQLVNKVKCS